MPSLKVIYDKNYRKDPNGNKQAVMLKQYR